MNPHLSTGALFVAAVFGLAGTSSIAAAKTAPSSSHAFATFVPPCAPAFIATNDGHTSSTSSPLQRQRSQATTTAIFAKKKAAAGGMKLQVKLLKDIRGTGQRGDVIMVAPAFFQNQLLRTQSAKLVTDDEVTEMNKEKDETAAAQLADAKRTQEMVEEVVTTTRKAGPEGHLFGGLSRKVIMEMLSERYPDGAWEGKKVKITSVKDGEGKNMKHDIKECGEYDVTVCLGSKLDAEFKLAVEAE